MGRMWKQLSKDTIGLRFLHVGAIPFYDGAASCKPSGQFQVAGAEQQRSPQKVARSLLQINNTLLLRGTG